MFCAHLRSAFQPWPSAIARRWSATKNRSMHAIHVLSCFSLTYLCIYLSKHKTQGPKRDGGGVRSESGPRPRAGRPARSATDRWLLVDGPAATRRRGTSTTSTRSHHGVRRSLLAARSLVHSSERVVGESALPVGTKGERGKARHIERPPAWMGVHAATSRRRLARPLARRGNKPVLRHEKKREDPLVVGADGGGEDTAWGGGDWLARATGPGRRLGANGKVRLRAGRRWRWSPSSERCC